MATLVAISRSISIEEEPTSTMEAVVIVESPQNITTSDNKGVTGQEDSSDRDSGSWSIEADHESTIVTIELPGADLTEEELIDTFTVEVVKTSRSVPPSPPPLPPLLPSAGSPKPILVWRSLSDLESRRFEYSALRREGGYVQVRENSPRPIHPHHVNFDLEEDTETNDDDLTQLCPICCDNKGSTRLLKCCNYLVCKSCVVYTIKTTVLDGRTYIPCLNPDCNKPMTREFITKQLRSEGATGILEKYERFRLNHEEDSTKKTCPNCCLITEREDLPPYKMKQITPPEYIINCETCSFQWCFNCHSPWHEGVSCEMYRLGDVQFQKWTKHRNAGYTPNCQKCPKCKVFIERSSGCDSMTCNRCHSNFCYKCGEHFRSYPLLGDHYKRLGVLGCPYNYLADEPVKRRLLRGGWLFVKASATTGYPILLVGGCAVVLVGAAVILPVVGSVALHRYIRRKRRGY